MQIIIEEKFAIAAINLSKKVLVFYMVFLNLSTKILNFPACEAQITLLVIEKVTILAEYLDY